MDYVTLVKQLIVALQALVAIYMSQLATLAPQNATTTVDLGSGSPSFALVVPSSSEILASTTDSIHLLAAGPQVMTTSYPWPETYVVDTGLVRQALASVVTNGGSPSVQFSFFPTKGTLFDSAIVTTDAEVFPMQINPVRYNGEDTFAAALTIPLASFNATSGDAVFLTAQIESHGNTSEHTYKIIIP